MESFAWYLLKSSIWLSGFSLVYLLFLRNERFFRIKRYYLVAGILASFFFPLITFHYSTALPADARLTGFQNLTGQKSGGSHLPGIGFDAGNLLIALYVGGIVFLLFKSLGQIASLLKRIRGKKFARAGKAKIVRSSEYGGSFSFLNYIFINPSISGPELDTIINHELVHVGQMHWIDLLLADVIRLIQWANPFAWIYVRLIRQNHEYLADEAVVETIANPALYKAVLVNQLLETKVFDLTNYFGYSLNKKRFEMMNKTFWPPYRKARLFMTVPVMVFIFYAFATPQYKPSDDGVSGNKVAPVSEVALTANKTGYQVLPRPDFDNKTAGRITKNEKNKSAENTGAERPAKPVDVVTPAPSPAEPYVAVQQMPYYPGGEVELLRFLAENTIYPQEALAKNIQGKVIVRFIINTEGNTEGITVIKGVDPLLDAEAKRVASLLSGFEPGIQNGRPVPVWYMVPINFVLPVRKQ